MDKTKPNSPRARLQQLLAIPERDRTDEEWDELNELEIAMAPGNRDRGPNHQHRPMDANQRQPGHGRPAMPGQGQGQGPGGPGQGKRRRFKPRNKPKGPPQQ